MRIAVCTDERCGIADALLALLGDRGHELLLYGAYAPGQREDWAWSAHGAAQAVAAGKADQGIVCCWTGTGASIAANKVAGIRAALCWDAQTAAGARRYNDANVLALSLRATTLGELGEILDAWFETAASDDAAGRANLEHLRECELR